MKVKNIIILAVVFVIVIVAAVFGYNYLSERYLPDSVPFDNPAAGDIPVSYTHLVHAISFTESDDRLVSASSVIT